MEVSGSGLIVEAFKKEGVDVLFGFPGGTIMPLFDELYKDRQIRVILNRHEQGAVHAADGYARSTGKPGVCIVTSGPGATNTITGLATANFDSVPIVCITAQVPTNMIGNDAFQEADIIGISRSVTKHNYLVTDRKHLGRIIKEAFFIASSGRPGPVVVDIPKDVLLASEQDSYPEEVNIRGYNPVYKGHSEQIKRAVSTLQRAKKPLFYAGGGIQIAGASDAFRRIVDTTGVPVISSLMGIGTVPSDHPLYLGIGSLKLCQRLRLTDIMALRLPPSKPYRRLLDDNGTSGTYRIPLKKKSKTNALVISSIAARSSVKMVPLGSVGRRFDMACNAVAYRKRSCSRFGRLSTRFCGSLGCTVATTTALRLLDTSITCTEGYTSSSVDINASTIR